MKIKTIVQYLEQLAPPIYQEKYDNAGLLVGNSDTECINALIALDVTEAVLDEAIDLGCNLVIAHHPIIFGGIKKLTGRNYVERTVIKAIKNDIAIFVAHTNLDNVHIGVNKKICDKLGLVDCQILRPKKNLLLQLQIQCPIQDATPIQQTLLRVATTAGGTYIDSSFQMLGLKVTQTADYDGFMQLQTVFPVHLKGRILGTIRKISTKNPAITYQLQALENANPQLGSGMIGTLPNPIKESEFLQNLKKTMSTDCVRYTRLLRKKVKKVAVCGGAGSFLLRDAISKGASVFVTADYKYHEFFDADNKIVIADIGHYESEQFTIPLFKEFLQKKFSNFDPLLSKINTNPIKYL